jgi:homoserine O-acetyltransferase
MTEAPRFLRPVTAPSADVGMAVTFETPLPLDCGRSLAPFTVAYMTYGHLNAGKSNAVLICHALTGDQFVASDHPLTGKPGWWTTMVGPGKPIDTDRFFVICANVLVGINFPLVTVRDMVRAQKKLIEHLGIAKLLAVVGGSMGGMQALQWAASYPESVRAVVPIACAARHSAQNIAFHEVGRQAIMADPDWKGGEYQLHGTKPSKGLAVARMAAHITYVSEMALQRKFGRALQNREALSFQFTPDFQIESYLHHQGASFVDRFDANSYLYITRAMDYFDLAEEHGGRLSDVFALNSARFCIIAFTSDWLFPPVENKRIAHALNAVAAQVSFVEIRSDKGHDAFLLEEPEMFATVRGFLNHAAMDLV